MEALLLTLLFFGYLFYQFCQDQKRIEDDAPPFILSPEGAQHWIDEYLEMKKNRSCTPEEYVETLRRRNIDEGVCNQVLKAIRENR